MFDSCFYCYVVNGRTSLQPRPSPDVQEQKWKPTLVPAASDPKPSSAEQITERPTSAESPVPPLTQSPRPEAVLSAGVHTFAPNTWCVRKVMTLNAWLDNWQCCSHISDTSRDIRSYLMISASFNSIALTRLI